MNNKENQEVKAKQLGRWSDDEIDLLIEVLETSNGSNYFQNYERKRQKQELPKRSKLSIKKKLSKLKKRADPLVDNFTLASLARFLGLPLHTSWAWQRAGLKSRKCGKHRIVTRKHLKLFAQEHPARFKRVDIDILKDLFDDELIEIIRNSTAYYTPIEVWYNPPNGKPKKFSSLKQAAEETFYVMGTVQWHIKNNTGLFTKA